MSRPAPAPGRKENELTPTPRSVPAPRRPAAPPRSAIAPIVIGILGCAILVGLGSWQVQRLAWKRDLIATLERRLDAPPSALPAAPDAGDEFSRVRVTGRFDGVTGSHGQPDAPFLTTRERVPGYRLIQPFTLGDGRRILVDRGFIPASLKNDGGAAVRPTPAPARTLTLTGALRFPDEAADPPFGTRDHVWVARDLEALARVFSAEPVLLMAETATPGPEGWPQPMPLGVDVPNNHLNYAITWFSLAAVWAVMSVLWLRRLRGGRPVPNALPPARPLR